MHRVYNGKTHYEYLLNIDTTEMKKAKWIDKTNWHKHTHTQTNRMLFIALAFLVPEIDPTYKTKRKNIIRPFYMKQNQNCNRLRRFCSYYVYQFLMTKNWSSVFILTSSGQKLKKLLFQHFWVWHGWGKVSKLIWTNRESMELLKGRINPSVLDSLCLRNSGSKYYFFSIFRPSEL